MPVANPLYNLLSQPEGYATLSGKACGVLPSSRVSEGDVLAAELPVLVDLVGWLVTRAPGQFPRIGAEFWASFTLVPPAVLATVVNLALFEGGNFRCVVPMPANVILTADGPGLAVPVQLMVGPSA